MEKKVAIKMYHKTAEVDTNDQLQERKENYEPKVTDRNSVVKLLRGKKRIEKLIAGENVAIEEETPTTPDVNGISVLKLTVQKNKMQDAIEMHFVEKKFVEPFNCASQSLAVVRECRSEFDLMASHKLRIAVSGSGA